MSDEIQPVNVNEVASIVANGGDREKRVIRLENILYRKAPPTRQKSKEILLKLPKKPSPDTLGLFQLFA